MIDDDEAIRLVIQMCLKKAGYEVATAAGRTQVTAALRSQPFDVVMTDILMPEFDGTDVIKAVRKHQPRAALVAMSGGGTYMTTEFSLNLANAVGATVSLTKPFQLEELLSAVKAALARKTQDVSVRAN